MNEHLTLGPEGAALVKHFENCMRKVGPGRFKAYKCPADVLTIGWGHTNHHGRKFNASTVWTQAECDEAFLEDMLTFEAEVKRLVKVPLSQHQYDALISIAYNIGSDALRRSTLLKKINRRDWTGAAASFAPWNKSKGRVLAGLVRRRASESLLFQGVPDRNYDGKPDSIRREPMPQAVDTPTPAGSVLGSKTAQAAGAAATTAVVAAGNEVVETAATGGTATDANSGMIEQAFEFLVGHGERIVSNPKFIAFAVIAIIGAAIIWAVRRKIREEGT